MVYNRCVVYHHHSWTKTPSRSFAKHAGWHQSAFRQAVQRMVPDKLHGALRKVQGMVLKRHLPCRCVGKPGKHMGELAKWNGKKTECCFERKKMLSTMIIGLCICVLFTCIHVYMHIISWYNFISILPKGSNDSKYFIHSASSPFFGYIRHVRANVLKKSVHSKSDNFR